MRDYIRKLQKKRKIVVIVVEELNRKRFGK